MEFNRIIAVLLVIDVSLWAAIFASTMRKSPPATDLKSRLDLVLEELRSLKNESEDLGVKVRKYYELGGYGPLRKESFKKYEFSRRELHRLVDELRHIGRTAGSAMNNEITLIINSLLNRLDIYETYRTRETNLLSRKIQRRLELLQNPRNCTSARKLVCHVNKTCGFACQIHHVVYCLITAYATGRTLILQSENWSYNPDGWETTFLPISETCRDYDDGEVAEGWDAVGNISNNHAKVLKLPVIDVLQNPPNFLPTTIPLDLAETLELLQDEPLIWWVGQFVKYILQPQPKIRQILDGARNKAKFDNKTRTVGIHIRRTDKIGQEAVFYPLDMYMKPAREYFSSLGQIEGKRVFLATDDPRVVKEACQKYKSPEWEIHADLKVAESAAISKRLNGSLIGIFQDLDLLSDCEFIICTLSSQVCRLAYELMQAKRSDASGRIISLDSEYYFGGGSHLVRRAAYANDPVGSVIELEFEVGDEILEFKRLDEHIAFGVNKRTGKNGTFPSYKIKSLSRREEFPTKWANTSMEDDWSKFFQT
ncbi:alpha-(1,6)-fucosyltransferase-like [Folsomia candida]|uniref:alpha-(1,6)-fucosyltransferase-like n=1 Tax=Folsomia candida TaxID=158441 RepID=UPI00160555E3|nr:alpha-(1,6)-fucosyltransferase-like [Folsomia candida]